VSAPSEDLLSFVDVVDKVAASVADRMDDRAYVDRSLAEAGLLELAQDTADEADSLQWLTHVVRASSQASPSLGFALASRYAADRALGARAVGAGASFTLALSGHRPVVTTLLEHATVVVLEPERPAVRTVSWAAVAGSATQDARSGLAHAGLVTVDVPDDQPGAEEGSAHVEQVLADWDLLTGAVFAGILVRALDTTSAYVLERRQFGVPIGSFAGLRALVADMAVRADAVQALLETSADRLSPSESVSVVAGRAAVEACLDAIQAHGGYGYIEEYPVAGLLRDSLSLQARAGGRRLHVARVAARRLGAPDRTRA
jgi:Acyl-CoA dehydrogenase, C-terminal domain